MNINIHPEQHWFKCAFGHSTTSELQPNWVIITSLHRDTGNNSLAVPFTFSEHFERFLEFCPYRHTYVLYLQDLFSKMPGSSKIKKHREQAANRAAGIGKKHNTFWHPIFSHRNERFHVQVMLKADYPAKL